MYSAPAEQLIEPFIFGFLFKVNPTCPWPERAI